MKAVTEATPRIDPPVRAQTPLGAQRSETPGPMATMMLIYLVVVVGRIGDIVPGMQNIPLAKIVAGLAILVAAQNWSTLPRVSIWSLRPARFTLLIMAISTVSILFSVWRHETLGIITGAVLSISVAMVLMIKSAKNWQAVRRLFLGCALSALVLALSVEITRHGGRAGFTRDLDPNDFAFLLVGLLPIVVAFVCVSRGLKKISFACASLWVIVEILRTESRGGLLGLVCVVALMIVLLPPNRRGRLLPRTPKAAVAARIMILAIASLLIWHVIPESARTRLATITHPDSGYNTNLNDPTGRFSIWLQTLPLSLRRPWGWGAGAFAAVDGMYGGGRYKAPHNMYLEALIDLGVAGLALFLATLVSSFRRLTREAFAQPEPVQQAGLERRVFARALIASLSGFCVSGFFLSEFYMQALWALIILTCLVGRSVITTNDVLQPIDVRQ